MAAPEVTMLRPEQSGDTTEVDEPLASTSDISVRQGADRALDDLIDYLEACCDYGTQGWLHVGVGYGPHLNGKGKYDHERFDPKPFRWPDEAGKAVEQLRSLSAAVAV